MAVVITVNGSVRSAFFHPFQIVPPKGPLSRYRIYNLFVWRQLKLPVLRALKLLPLQWRAEIYILILLYKWYDIWQIINSSFVNIVQ